MPLYTAPGVRFEPADTGSQGIAALRTDVAGFVGVCERGPLDAPLRAGSWEQFRTAFGGLVSNAILPWSVKAFFENGGRTCWIVRVAAQTTSTTTSGTQPSDRQSSKVLDASGFAAGAVATLAQSIATTTATIAQPAGRQSSVVASAAGFIAGAVAMLSQTTQTTSTGAAQPADRRSSLVADVTGFTPGALVEVTQAGKTTHLLVSAADAATNTLVWDTPLDATYNLAATLHFRTTWRDARRVHRVDGPTIHWTVALDQQFDLARAIAIETVARSERLIAGVTGATVAWTRPYGGEYDPAQPIDVSTGASAASGVLLDATGTPTLRVDAASPGAWGNAVSVVVSRTSRQATRSAGVQPSNGAFSVVESVAGISAGSVLQIFQPGSRTFHRVVSSVDAARKRIFWREPLGNLDLTQPFSLESDEITIAVYERANLREVLDRLTLVAGDDQHDAPAVVNAASRYLRLTDLASPAPPPLSHPNPQSPALDNGRLLLAGGRDGIAALRADDITGTFTTDDRAGLRTLELVDEVSYIAIPDVLIERVPALEVLPDPPPPPPDPCLLAPPPLSLVAAPPPPAIREQSAHFNLDEVLRVQNAMIDHCERLRDRMALLDPPNFRATELAEIDSWRRRFDTKYAALYFPWIVVLDPQNSRDLTRAIPPSGHVAGIWARTDLTTGVHKAPANEELRWAQDSTIDVTEAVHEILNPAGINAIRLLPARGLRVYGARTVSSDPSWRYVSVRRLLIMIEEAVEEALQWAVFEPHDAALREKVAMSIYSFLERLWERGALAGATAGEAFYIRCNESNNPPDAVANGHLLAEVGVAPVIPAEFIVFRIGRTEDVLETSEPEGGA
ncbi:MAG: uncharacterized protein QOC81_1065 [Thermoanaerobaculia bacterium]|jgi:phage tail sheath protein FI|nr:uncharacterized protein [Thermoanaerobaculia bacterium]